MRKWTIWLGIILIAAAAGAGAYYFYFAKDKEETAENVAAQTVTAIKGSIVNQISGTGSVSANSRETLTAGKSGTIAAVNVKQGDIVKAGQTIATFEASDDFEDQIESIQKDIDKLQDSIEQYQEQYKEATGTENEEDTKETIKNSIEDANSEIADYEEELQDIYEEQSEQVKSITANIDGEITELAIEAGDEVQANTTIATVVDYTKLEFVTSVDELDIGSVKEGQAVDITLSSITDRTIDGTVAEISREGTSSNGSSSFEVSILLNDIEGVLAGMSGEAAITIESKEDIVLVPVNAVVEMAGRSFVRVPQPSGGQADGSADGGEQPGGRGQGGWAGGQAPAGDGQMPAEDGQGQAPAGGGQIPAGDGQGQAPAMSGQGARQAMMEAISLGGQLVEVATGLSNETYVEIVSGISEGDSVLVPLPMGMAGMGSGEEETMTQMQGFPGGMGGFGGGGMVFPGGNMGGGGGFVRSSSGGGGGAGDAGGTAGGGMR